MAIGIGFGRYCPGDSPIHRLDPRCKAVCVLALMVTTFAITTAGQLAIAVAGALGLVMATGVPLRRTLDSVRPVLLFILVIGLLDLFFVSTGETLLAAGPVRVTTGGVWTAVLYTCRFAVLVLYGATLLLTTTPTALTDAFESLLSPLARLGLHVHEISMVLSLALRFVPTLADECSAIMDAQAARGSSLANGGPTQRLRAFVAVLMPMFAGALRHASGLSRALDARCYEGGSGRTHYHVLRLGRRDAWFSVATLAYVAVLLALGMVGAGV